MSVFRHFYDILYCSFARLLVYILGDVRARHTCIETFQLVVAFSLVAHLSMNIMTLTRL
jgi:hypothetical protein